MLRARLTDEREHRRGLVLGLTLAEILLLLLFLILLALAALLADLQFENETYRTAFRELDPIMKQLKLENGDAVKEVRELAERLRSVAKLEEELAQTRAHASELREVLDSLAPTEKARHNLEEAVRVAAQIDPNDPPAVLKRALIIFQSIGAASTPDQAKGLTELAAENQGLKESVTAIQKERDQFRKERDYVMKSGKGSDYPPCWFGADEKPQFIFEIDIHNGGLVVRDVVAEGRAQDLAWRLVDPLQRGIEISGEQFSKGTDALFQWSKANNCRFFVRVRDATGETNKRDYKRNLGVVEGHFYKLLLEHSVRARQNQKRKSNQSGPKMISPQWPPRVDAGTSNLADR